MTRTESWVRASALCGQCGRPVFFDQLTHPTAIMAICSNDPDHIIGPAAQHVLDQVRQDNRPC
jgi:hypothetical protein